MNREQVLDLIANAPKGEERAKLLENPEIRKAVLSSGANVTIYSGEINSEAKFSKGMFADVFVGLIQRKNKKGKLITFFILSLNHIFYFLDYLFHFP